MLFILLWRRTAPRRPARFLVHGQHRCLLGHLQPATNVCRPTCHEPQAGSQNFSHSVSSVTTFRSAKYIQRPSSMSDPGRLGNDGGVMSFRPWRAEVPSSAAVPAAQVQPSLRADCGRVDPSSHCQYPSYNPHGPVLTGRFSQWPLKTQEFIIENIEF